MQEARIGIKPMKANRAVDVMAASLEDLKLNASEESKVVIFVTAVACQNILEEARLEADAQIDRALAARRRMKRDRDRDRQVSQSLLPHDIVHRV